MKLSERCSEKNPYGKKFKFFKPIHHKDGTIEIPCEYETNDLKVIGNAEFNEIVGCFLCKKEELGSIDKAFEFVSEKYDLNKKIIKEITKGKDMTYGEFLKNIKI